MGFWDDLIRPLLLPPPPPPPPPRTYSSFTSSSNDNARYSAVLLFALVTLLFIKWGSGGPSLNISVAVIARKVQEHQVGWKLNGTHQLLAYADNVNLLGNNMDTIRKNIETLIGASKEVGLEINVEKTKYMCHSSNIWGRQ
jgi:hypothetical protein